MKGLRLLRREAKLRHHRSLMETKGSTMLCFYLTEDQERLKARARAFARDVVAPHVAEMDRTNNYPWPVVKAMAQEGFMGLTRSEERRVGKECRL